MWTRHLLNVGLSAVFLTGWTAAAAAQTAAQGRPVAGTNVVTIRGERQDVYYLPAQGKPLHHNVLFVPGVGGWRGWAITVGEAMASWGYDVYGLDTKTYLDDFSSHGQLTEADVAGDMCAIAHWTTGGSAARVTFVGWSEGAGLGVLGAAGGASKKTLAGLITFGLADENVIAWHWSDNLESFIRKPQEPTFHAASYMSKVSPLPLVMIQSGHDQYVGVDESKRLFAAAAEPKQFKLVPADNHRFDGNHKEFFVKLREGLQWIDEAH